MIQDVSEEEAVGYGATNH
uniref:Uncharacterized protein n=1 Tax=Lepeophtheirus salmonis TaxID=72036 RepID=A0A0K2T881_LEPSM